MWQYFTVVQFRFTISKKGRHSAYGSFKLYVDQEELIFGVADQSYQATVTVNLNLQAGQQVSVFVYLPVLKYGNERK